MRRVFGILTSLLLCVAAGARGTREVYVWQRQFGGEVVTALQRFRPQIDGCCVLAAEVSWSRDRAQVVRIALDFPALVALQRPVALALRVGAYGGSFASDDAAAGALGALAAEIIAKARAAGLEPAELQVDFDCAESKLAGYCTWLKSLRVAAGGTKVVFTALPVWLKHAEFGALAQAADGFVLQVHSLEKPAGPDAPFTLCDPERALAWARQADAVGVPFRVALPTYGYVTAFTAEGKFLGLAAEGPRPAWPAGTQVRLVRADPIAMAQLTHALLEEPPLHCVGVIWFRLPIASDRLNWDAATLATVLRGETPKAQLGVDVTWSEHGLAEVFVVNSGTTREALPAQVALHWPDAERLQAADGLGGFRLDTHGGAGQAMIVATAVPPDALLAPGRRLKIAWLRFSHELPLDALVPASISPR